MRKKKKMITSGTVRNINGKCQIVEIVSSCMIKHVSEYPEYFQYLNSAVENYFSPDIEYNTKTTRS